LLLLFSEKSIEEVIMKKSNWTLMAAFATALLTSSGVWAAEQTERTVSFRTGGYVKYYISMVPQGGLSASGKEIAERQVFKLVDLNGGELADGDSIQIKYAPADGKPSYWHEGEGVVNRVGTKPDEACTFKVKLKEKSDKEKSDKAAPTILTLQTASGKFVSITSRTDPLVTTDVQDKAAVLEIMENPVVKPTP
jgi:hypothetical protein